MNDLPTPAPSRLRFLILDRNPAGPKWVIATVSIATDVRAALLDEAGRYQDWLQVADWLAAQVGGHPFLIPVADALAWRVDERS